MERWFNKKFNNFFGVKAGVEVTNAFGTGLAVFVLTNLVWILYTAIFPNIR